MEDIKKLFVAALQSLREREPVIWVTVIASSGSTPRGAGAMMIVRRDGVSLGTIGGGAVEFAAQKRAAELLKLARSESVGYVLNKSDVANLGMVCGGNVTVYFHFLDPADEKALELLDYIVYALGRNENAWLVRRIEAEQVTGMGVYDKSGLHFTDCITEDELKPYLGWNTVLLQGEPGYYIEPLTLEGRVYVFGGGHVAQEVVPLLAHLGFRVVLYEDREQFATKTLFPAAEEIILGSFSEIEKKISITQYDYVVIMTRGHQMDFELLAQTIRTPARYIGCIGSRKKVAAVKEKLAAIGISEEEFLKVNTPIGLEIGAQTPAEIAVSIAAEMIKHRASDR
ncbi:MAG: XdhC family protein [Clostridiales bacterium]|jgi:xanthine dehydrogenase accessory factor|nr:XdhC family protein [Clostridiales bacterium]